MKSRTIAREYNSHNNTKHFFYEDFTKKKSNIAFKARKLKHEAKIKTHRHIMVTYS